MSNSDNMMESEDAGILSDFKKSIVTSGVKINPSDRATLLSGHKPKPALAGEVDFKSSGELGNIYFGIRCKPGISLINFLALPFISFSMVMVNYTYISLE